jgi:hypothetical protein
VCPNQGSLAEKGRISTIDLLFWQLVKSTPFYTEKLFGFITKQANLMRRSIVLSLPIQLVFPARSNTAAAAG